MSSWDPCGTYTTIDRHDESCDPAGLLAGEKQDSCASVRSVLRPGRGLLAAAEAGINGSPYPTSQPVPSFFIKFWLTRAWRISSVIPRPRVIGVKTMPGHTQFTRMFSVPCCAAMARVIWMMAPFVVG